MDEYVLFQSYKNDVYIRVFYTCIFVNFSDFEL